MSANSFCAFLSFRVLILFGFLLLHLEAVFTSACFVLTDYVCHGTLSLVLCLVGMHSAAASKWALTKFSYSNLFSDFKARGPVNIPTPPIVVLTEFSMQMQWLTSI